MMTFHSGIRRRAVIRGIAAAAVLGARPFMGVRNSRAAGAWPDKPIRAISPISAGSASDIITRTVLEDVSSRLGQPIVVENHPGADGTIGSADVVRAEPDGYTILSHSAALTVVASTHTDLPYDTVRDFAAVTPMARIPSVLVVAPSKNMRALGELVSDARGRSLTYASPGAFTQLNTERFCRAADIVTRRIPFKGAPEALAEVVAGRIDFYFAPVFAALPLIETGRLAALAVTGPARSARLPDTPTFAESGYPDVDDNFWIGLFVPARTPRAIVDRLHDAAVEAIRSPAVVDKLTKFGAVPMTATPDQFEQMIERQISENAVIVKAAGISRD
jgi:tripartite-type tricarboxylate transporter receptor subunit TctC